MNTKLLDLVSKKTSLDNFEEVKDNIASMICTEGSVSLNEDILCDALSGEGEFFLLKARYEDFHLEKEHRLLEKKLKEALHITICFEDNGDFYTEIERFVKYIFEHTTKEQKFYFGVKQVKKLGEYPVKILLSEIYPINQLQIHLGEWIYDFISSDTDYFQERFAQARAKISHELGITILPLDVIVNDDLAPNDVVLLDSLTKEKIVAFSIEKSADKKALDIYLLKLYYVFLKLGVKYKH